MNDAPTLLVVCDAGPLIHLDQLDCLDLLADFSRVVVPDVVWREVEHHRPTALDQKTIRLERLEPREEPSAELISLHRLLALHAGEVQALQLAQELDADFLLTDDSAAKLAAKTLHVSAHGTLGVLLRAIRRRQRTPKEILNVLNALPVRSTLHVKRELLDEIIRQVEALA
jgi:predicted nucleic acid-binding protein